MTEVVAHSGLLSKTRVHVEDTGGTGRPVVLIHGWPLSGESWEGQVGPLTDAGFRVIRYDRRGFGRSDRPSHGYDYDTLADDLAGIIGELGLADISLVGFSMGGGEVARYVARHGESLLHSVIFAAAVTPYLMKTDDNPDGPLDEAHAAEMAKGLTADRERFFNDFTTAFYSVGDDLKVTDAQRAFTIALSHQSDEKAALACMHSFGTTDFRADLGLVTVPTLVIHGNGDGVVPFEGSGQRTHSAIAHSDLVVIDDAPHGLNVSHADHFNRAIIDFLSR